AHVVVRAAGSLFGGDQSTGAVVGILLDVVGISILFSLRQTVGIIVFVIHGDARLIGPLGHVARRVKFLIDRPCHLIRNSRLVAHAVVRIAGGLWIARAIGVGDELEQASRPVVLKICDAGHAANVFSHPGLVIHRIVFIRRAVTAF